MYLKKWSFPFFCSSSTPPSPVQNYQMHHFIKIHLTVLYCTYERCQIKSKDKNLFALFEKNDKIIVWKYFHINRAQKCIFHVFVNIWLWFIKKKKNIFGKYHRDHMKNLNNFRSTVLHTAFSSSGILCHELYISLFGQWMSMKKFIKFSDWKFSTQTS